MQRISAHTIGIQKGSRAMFADFADDGVMWTGDGPRESRHIITFDESYAAPPTVIASISLWDMDHRSNSRAHIVSENITPTGFDLVFRTWGDSHVARIRADWLAIGPLHSDDEWDVD